MYEFKDYTPSEILRGHMKMGGKMPTGETVDINSRYIEIDKKPYLGVMGEYHYARAHRKDWKRELLKMKAGGIGIVASYIFWNYHEEEEGVFDFSGDRDLQTFVRTATEAGLKTVLRIGPWAHGEVRYGGFPDWLINKNIPLRENDPEYLSYVRRFFAAIRKALGDDFPGKFSVIAIQIENELVDNAEHIKTLKDIAIEEGLTAPIYTATGWNSMYGAKLPLDEVLPVFGSYADAPWAEGTDPLPLSPHFAFHPERNDSAIGMDLIHNAGEETWRLPYERYPFVTCEIGPGMASTHHRRVVLSGMDAYAMSLVKLGVGNNLVGYYMYHGGTNKIGKYHTLNETVSTGYPNDYPILNYDFGTCLSQFGEIRESYRLLNILHLFINDFGHILAPMEHVGAWDFVDENNLSDLRYCMRTDGESAFIYVNHHQRHAKLKDVKEVSFKAGNVTLPAINVNGDISFILPVNIKLEKETLTYSTAQLLCRDENTFFFMVIPGIKAEFKFEGTDAFTLKAGESKNVNDIKIVTLSFDEARFVRKLDGKVYIGEDCDIFLEDGEIRSAEAGSFGYRIWNKEGFNEVKKHEKETEDALLSIEDHPPIDVTYPEPLEIGGPRKLTFKSLKVSSAEGFVIIDEKYDAMQIYADGELIADKFYENNPYRIPAKMLYGRDCVMAMSELKDDIYIEPDMENAR